MRVADRRVEKRPLLCGSEQIRHGGERQIPKVSILDARGVELPGRCRKTDPAQPQHKILQRASCMASFVLPTVNGWVLVIRKLFRQLAQLAVDGVDGKRDDVGVVRRDGGVEDAGEIGDFLERCADAVAS